MSKKPEMQARPLDLSNTPGAFDLNSLLRREAEGQSVTYEAPATTEPPSPPATAASPSPPTAARQRKLSTTAQQDRFHSIRLTLPHATYRELSLLAIDLNTDRQALVIEGIEAIMKIHRRGLR